MAFAAETKILFNFTICTKWGRGWIF